MYLPLDRTVCEFLYLKENFPKQTSDAMIKDPRISNQVVHKIFSFRRKFEGFRKTFVEII